jgi:cysteine synthase
MQTFDSIIDAIGNTPLVRLRRLVEPGWADVSSSAST